MYHLMMVACEIPMRLDVLGLLLAEVMYGLIKSAVLVN